MKQFDNKDFLTWLFMEAIGLLWLKHFFTEPAQRGMIEAESKEKAQVS